MRNDGEAHSPAIIRLLFGVVDDDDRGDDGVVLLPATPLPIPTKPVLSMAQRQAELRYKAMTVLAKYLQEGDRTTLTEVLTNGQGQELNRKITQIQRGCPSWAIDQIQKLQD